ncbi:hypothetical protein OIU85_002771 [Salix viminalis]|uniref:Cation efflux protein cytoplasmic domain-containing protein n=1 Tax=Salix viminalis TaxID=40686 RepID=A0A6N2NLC3_SALVM|nr:hypothetical protein OIU85_002771 [Salix viminalis]KAJ6752371.1 hypothetical protein OIU85_002771 [Salix viminalis]
MDVRHSEHGRVIEVNIDVPAVENSLGGSRICAGASCGFSDAQTVSKDAKERGTSMKKLGWAVGLCILFMGVEIAGGIKANSLAILTDAAHLLSDVAAFAISLFSIWASGWEATPRRTYGYFRIEILGALISIQMIWLLAGILVYEAIVRLIHETGEVEGALMFAIATVGLLVNIGMAFMLGHDHGHGHGHGHGHEHGHEHGGHNHDHSDDGHEDHDHTHNHSHEDHDHTHNHSNEDHDHTHDLRLSAATHQGSSENNDEHHHTHGEDLAEPLLSTHTEVDNKTKEGRKQKKQRNVNIQGAYLHVLGDSIQSVGVMIGGAIIWYKPEWKIIDLICTLVFSVIVLGTTIGMIRNILEVLMESTPREIDATKLEQGLCEMDEVVAIHELHIWAITVGKFLLACHVMIKSDADADMVLDKVVDYIRREHNITHVTIQIERQ